MLYGLAVRPASLPGDLADGSMPACDPVGVSVAGEGGHLIAYHPVDCPAAKKHGKRDRDYLPVHWRLSTISVFNASDNSGPQGMWLLISKDRLMALMVTDISPIFGMSLTALIEMATIIGAAVGIGSAGIIARVIRNSNRALLRQQKKMDSAKLVWDLSIPWSNDEKFKRFLDDLLDPAVTKYDLDQTYASLELFETIAIVWKSGLLQEFHMRASFSSNLRSIRMDKFIQDLIAKEQKENPRTYMYLMMLLEKSKEWDS